MIENTDGVRLLDAESGLVPTTGGGLAIKRTQEITDGFLSGLAASRDASRHGKMGEMHKVASIPTVIVEKWMREGFNIFDKNISLKDIIRKLNSEDMQNLMATERNVI